MKIYKYLPVESNVKLTRATLLSAREFENYKEHIPTIAGECWLRDKGNVAGFAAWVYLDSLNERHADAEGYPVDTEKYIQPAVWFEDDAEELDVEKMGVGEQFVVDKTVFTVVADGLAVVNEPIGKFCFDKESDNYDHSYVKTVIDNWFETLCAE
ncbi:MAG: hypothetical protein E7527_04965 [Ruminococcaceae bacterium]|nr:hypothetical protein [Oscillospiraceae bacterium]